MKKNEYIGVRFGLLTPTKELPKRIYSNGKTDRIFECACDCGNTKVAIGQNLRSGNTKSCGCLRISKPSNKTHGMTGTPEFRSYRHMLSRCFNENVERFPHYGGRGITVCDEWRGNGGFDRFIEHIGKRPSPQHSLDRIDADGNYEPGNVRWALPAEQMRNRQNAIKIIYEGVERPLKELCEAFSVPYLTAWKRYRRGVPVEKIFGDAIRQ